MSGIIAGAVVVAAAGAKIAYGASQNHKASEIEKENPRPVMGVDPIYQQNVNTAQTMAEQGMPSQSYNNQLNSINRSQAGAIGALNNSANPGANLASIVRAGNDANNNLNAQDAIQRNRNTMALIQQRGILANANQNAWNYNYANKYSENLAKSQALRGAGSQNISGGIGMIGQAGQMYAGGAGGFGGFGGSSGGGQNLTSGYYSDAPVGAGQSTIS